MPPRRVHIRTAETQRFQQSTPSSVDLPEKDSKEQGIAASRWAWNLIASLLSLPFMAIKWTVKNSWTLLMMATWSYIVFIGIVVIFLMRQ